MTTLPNLGLVLPDEGGSSGVWDTLANAIYGLIDAHDHSSGKGLAINSDAITIDGDVSFVSLWAPTNLHRIAFSSVTALASGSKSLFVSSADNELYWRSNGGANVKLTSGSALNVAGFAGGIGGDYSAVSAEVAFDDANDRYTFKQQGAVWARNASGEVRIYETGTSETVYVGFAAPAALGASYTMTFPTALPGTTQLLQLSAAGLVSASNTVAEAVTLSSSLTVGTTLGVTGLITATAGLTAAANQHLTVSGTGEIKHGDRILVVSSQFGNVGSNWVIDGGTGGMTSQGAGNLDVPLGPFLVGDRIKSIIFELFGDGAADLTGDIFRRVKSTSASSLSAISITNQAAAWSDHTFDVTDTTIAAGDVIFIRFTASATGLFLGAIRVTYDHP